MFLVSGIGNPGKEYEGTPHNAGFLFVDMLKEYFDNSTEYQVDDWIDESKLFKSLISKVRKEGEVVGILQKPTTYMNRSGEAVRNISEKFKIDMFVLVHDDLDIKLGDVKIQRGKAPKGHKGVLSVEEGIKTTDFLRVRIGIENRDNMNIPGEDYVLHNFTFSELETLDKAMRGILLDVVSNLNI